MTTTDNNNPAISLENFDEPIPTVEISLDEFLKANFEECTEAMEALTKWVKLHRPEDEHRWIHNSLSGFHAHVKDMVLHWINEDWYECPLYKDENLQLEEDGSNEEEYDENKYYPSEFQAVGRCYAGDFQQALSSRSWPVRTHAQVQEEMFKVCCSMNGNDLLDEHFECFYWVTNSHGYLAIAFYGDTPNRILRTKESLEGYNSEHMLSLMSELNGHEYFVQCPNCKMDARTDDMGANFYMNNDPEGDYETYDSFEAEKHEDGDAIACPCCGSKLNLLTPTQYQNS